MKQYITMKKLEGSSRYKVLETMNFKFASLNQLFNPFIRSGELIDWIGRDLNMKQFITMKKDHEYNIYQGVEVGDYRFVVIWSLFSPYIRAGELIAWLSDEKNSSHK
jgi:hypothetical protein